MTSLAGWEEYSVVRDDLFTTHLSGPDPDYDTTAYLALYGSTGMTAYIGHARGGEGVGGGDRRRLRRGRSHGVDRGPARQDGRLPGHRHRRHPTRSVPGWWTSSGLDGAINHRTENIAGAAEGAGAPKRVDVFFDNVGGPVLDAVLTRLAMHARVALCGAIADLQRHRAVARAVELRQPHPAAGDHDRVPGPRRRAPHARDRRDPPRLGRPKGKLRYQADVFDGLGASVDALNAMFEGHNIGKIVIRLER